MRSTRPVYSTLFLLLLTAFLTCLTSATIARAADDADDEAEDYDVKARVARISLLSGAVSLKRKDNTEWEPARLNYPLVEGDTISTAADTRVEIQIDARNFVRLGAESILRIVTLRDEGVALSIVEGTASVRLAKFAPDKEYFEVDAPKATLAVEKAGLYRIDVGKDGRVRLTARDGGRARIYSETSGFALRDGRAADLLIDGPDAGEWEMQLTAIRDSWDDWLDERESVLAQSSHYDTQYYDSDVWGAEDLDSYGAWIYSNEYGWIWRPHPSVISSYPDWAPYRYGDWTWVDPYGWTWVGNEPWAWAPYHFGRWVYYNNYWAWCPRSQYYRKRSWWRPALVAFDLSFGNEICWYPLSYHHRDPRSRNYHRGGHDRPGGPGRPGGPDRRGHDDRNDRRRYPGHWGGVTGIPARDFGGPGRRPHRVGEREGRRVVSAEPFPVVPGRPVRNPNRPTAGGNRPNGSNGPGGTGGNGVDRRTWTRRDGSVPDPASPQRRTGAAERNPGIPLDRELRRSRVWNGREERRQELPVPTGGVGAVETRPTGVVERPTRREVERNVGPRNEGDRRPQEDRDVNRSPERGDRVARPNRETRPNAPQSSPPPGETQAAPSSTPASAPAHEERRPAERPVRSEPDRRTAPVDRGERPAVPERRERSAESPRQAPAERRSEPAPTSEQPSRHERPTRSEPPARNDRPTQHSEPARSEPAPRNDPPPPAPSEPARSEPAPAPPPPPAEPARSEPAPAPPPPPAEPARSEPAPAPPPPPPAEPARSEPAPAPPPPPAEPARSEPAPAPPPPPAEPARSEPAPAPPPPPAEPARSEPAPAPPPPSEPARPEPQPRDDPPAHVEPPARSELPRSEPIREEDERPKTGKDPR